MRRAPQARQQAGDTIVEVLICIAVVALVLTAAFAISNRSTLTVQDSNEHSQAALYLQSQVESFRSYMQKATSTPSAGTSYCMSEGQLHVVTQPTDALCTLSTTGSGANYKLSFSNSSADNNTYTFVASWDSINGGQAQESYIYRVYPGQP